MYSQHVHQCSSQKAVWILAHESQESLARSVVVACEQWQRRTAQQPHPGAEKTRTIEFKPLLKWNKFHDGFPDLFIESVREMAGKDVILIASFHSVDVIFEQVSMMYAIPRYLAHSVTVILPYFPTGTMERIDLEGQVATAKTLAMILSRTPSTARGPTQIMIFDIHALQERFYFSNEVIPRLETAIPLLLHELKSRSDEYPDQQISIAFPDDGAGKRFSRLFPDHWERIICHKTRDGDKRFIKIKDGDPVDKHVIVVDDLVQTGGTLLEATKVIKAAGAKSVSCYVTHAVFPKESWRKFTSTTDGGGAVRRFWITDSLPHSRQIAANPPFQLLSLAPMIADILLGFDLRQLE